ncbi:aldehyde dehydrogenase family protein [Streptomyces sp. TG1A-8]|uniref:aldehyde dehydrogenase family protein n=1 Tax=Streptomyces sp. TG1A-8 TaxID=3051385 RepID=UPI00265C16E5|nr:aldehyde dehydrogenase family protein [Streptomyces sp. TG1A-8]MDO0929939.1 aldehyde dehydrogenase family protein [Streptomyces sp. TG1A-8]
MTTSTATPAVTRLRWSSTDPADQFTVHDPATGEAIATLQGAGPQQVDAAVRAAHAAQQNWRRRSHAERGAVLRRIADTIREHAAEIAAIETSDNGKPTSQAEGFDLAASAAIFDLFAGSITTPPSAAAQNGPLLDVTTLEPYGVIGAIVPFNWPPIHTAGKLAPALAVGNAVVLKPPEQAPLSVLRLIELIEEIVPDDVVHVVPGRGPVGAALAAHRLVGKISFTGAPATGVSVLKTAADNLTPALLELGGKNPFIVFDDADLDSAVPWLIEGGYFNQGEACTAASRLLVQDTVYDEVADRVARAVRRLTVGDGADPATHVGPLVTSEQQRRVLDYLDIGRAEGAVLHAQAELPADPRLAGGYYVPPTLLTQVAPTMRVANEEIFGPVVTMIRFRDEDEAVRIANGTPFGLVAGVFSGNHQRALRTADAVRAGLVFINHYNRAAVGVPFGGTGASGYGREHAHETLHEFGYSKSLRIPNGLGPIPRWQPSLDVTATPERKEPR